MDEACKSNGIVAILFSGGRVSNTWVTHLQHGNNACKRALIPDVVSEHKLDSLKWGTSNGLAVDERPMGYQLVGVVMAHQG